LVNSGRSRSMKRATALGSHLLRAPRWKAARWAAVAVVVANLIGLNAWAWKQQAALDAKRQAVREVLTSTFPGVRVVVDAPVQMGRELSLLRQAAGGTSSGDFESLMTSFVAVVPVNRVPTAIEFVAPELQIKGLGLTSAQVAQGAEQLKSRGISLRSDGDTVVIRAEGAP
jgi:general secretion pathway protein L